MEEGGFRSLSNLAGSRKTTEPAAFKLKSCSHPLCCKIRFPLFSEVCHPWKHPPLSRSAEPASCRSAGQGTISQPPLRTHMARSAKLQRGKERDDPCLQKRHLGAESLSSFILKRDGRAWRTSTTPTEKRYTAKSSDRGPRPPRHP